MIDMLAGLVQTVVFLVELSRLIVKIASAPRRALAQAGRAIRGAPRWWWDN